MATPHALSVAPRALAGSRYAGIMRTHHNSFPRRIVGPRQDPHDIFETPILGLDLQPWNAGKLTGEKACSFEVSSGAVQSRWNTLQTA
jgi:hypothetical protein